MKCYTAKERNPLNLTKNDVKFYGINYLRVRTCQNEFQKIHSGNFTKVDDDQCKDITVENRLKTV